MDTSVKQFLNVVDRGRSLERSGALTTVLLEPGEKLGPLMQFAQEFT